MGIEQRRWGRRLLVATPVVAWPVVFLLWLSGTAVSIAFAAFLLWSSALTCVFGIIARPLGTIVHPDRHVVGERSAEGRDD